MTILGCNMDADGWQRMMLRHIGLTLWSYWCKVEKILQMSCAKQSVGFESNGFRILMDQISAMQCIQKVTLIHFLRC